TIPEWLNGSLIRNGPGSLKVGDDNEFSHLFDSSALLHRFGIKNGQVTYQSRFLQSETFKKNWAANRIVLTEFGTKSVPDPCHTIFQRIAAMFNPDVSDNSMISVYPFGDELYAFNEIPIIHKINPETLSTEGRVNVNDYISIINHTSHPHVMQDGEESTMFEKAKIVAAIPARWPLHPSYMHTFGITENYYVIVEQPLSISVSATVTAKLTNEPLAGCFRWYQDEYTQINVICRKRGCLLYKFYAETFFYLHIIHQYEIDDYIILDICIYRDPSMLDCLYIETMKCMQQNPNYAKMFRSRPARFVLPLNPDPMEMEINVNLVKIKNTNAKAYYLPHGEILLKPERLCIFGCETPRINYEHFLGKPYRYFYAISSDVDAENPGTFEDDGVVLAAMVWGGRDANHAGLLVLDAKTFIEIGRAEFRTPSPVPKCLHGWFLPQNHNVDSKY
ncbi:hypothetical protein NQ314_008235, partial [Rhamnusium bicolor]